MIAYLRMTQFLSHRLTGDCQLSLGNGTSLCVVLLKKHIINGKQTAYSDFTIWERCGCICERFVFFTNQSCVRSKHSQISQLAHNSVVTHIRRARLVSAGPTCNGWCVLCLIGWSAFFDGRTTAAGRLLPFTFSCTFDISGTFVLLKSNNYYKLCVA